MIKNRAGDLVFGVDDTNNFVEKSLDLVMAIRVQCAGDGHAHSEDNRKKNESRLHFFLQTNVKEKNYNDPPKFRTYSFSKKKIDPGLKAERLVIFSCCGPAFDESRPRSIAAATHKVFKGFGPFVRSDGPLEFRPDASGSPRGCLF